MEVSFQTCLLVCPLVFLAGFVDSVAGGGGIISLPAYLSGRSRPSRGGDEQGGQRLWYADGNGEVFP